MTAENFADVLRVVAQFGKQSDLPLKRSQNAHLLRNECMKLLALPEGVLSGEQKAVVSSIMQRGYVSDSDILIAGIKAAEEIVKVDAEMQQIQNNYESGAPSGNSTKKTTTPAQAKKNKIIFGVFVVGLVVASFIVIKYSVKTK